jgi:hypothetical protein
VQTLVGKQTLSTLPASDQATLAGREFFPHLISQPFHHGLVIAFGMAIVMSVIGAVASLFRGTRYIHVDDVGEATPAVEAA